MQLSDAKNFVPYCNHTTGPYNPMITDIEPFPIEHPHPLSIEAEESLWIQRPGGHIKYRIYCKCGAYCEDKFTWKDSERHNFVLRVDVASFKMITSSHRHQLIVRLYTLNELGCGNEAAQMSFLIEGKKWELCALSV